MLMYYMPFFDGSNYFSVDNVRLDLEFLSPKQVEKVYPHIHGADTKFPKKIPVTEGQLLPPQNPMTESVCIIFSECIFADNTFWSFLMFFRKKRDANGTSFSNCFSIMIFFFLFALNQCISVSIRQYDSTRLLQSKSRTFKDGCKRKSLYASRLAISIVP